MGRLSAAVLALPFVFATVELAGGEDSIQWEEVTVLPPAKGELIQPGLAGAFAGVDGDVMLIGGGANFPQGLPWEGGPKVWWDTVFVLEKKAGETSVTYEWAEEQGKLPTSAAYGVSIPLDDGVLCIGGCDAKSCFADVYAMQWNEESRAVEMVEYPPLPRPLAFMAGARVGDWVFVAGGQEAMEGGRSTKDFFGLDLSQQSAGADAFKWVELPSWDGPSRILPVVAAAENGSNLYLWSGRNPDPDGATSILTDAYSFDTSSKTWTKLPDVGVGESQARCIMAAASVATPGETSDGILVFGGADGVLMQVLEHNGRKARSDNRKEAEAFGKFNIALLQNHPGFSRDVLAFDPGTGSWSKVGDFPDSCPVTTPAVRWGGSVFLPSGEIRPGVRSGRIWKGTVVKKAETVR
ncbi:MAG: SSS family solute:Na+ symporter [Verrucomicrobiales bacterium]|jgi:SSS family solute:Na+ symporter